MMLNTPYMLQRVLDAVNAYRNRCGIAAKFVYPIPREQIGNALDALFAEKMDRCRGNQGPSKAASRSVNGSSVQERMDGTAPSADAPLTSTSFGRASQMPRQAEGMIICQTRRD